MEKRVKIQGCSVDIIDFEGTLNFAQNSIINNKPCHVVTINPEMVQNSKKNKEFAAVLNEAELVVPDGVGIKIAMKLKGIQQNQIRGVDFAKKLIQLCSEKNYSLALLGAKEHVVKRLAEILKDEYKNINIVYCANGYFDDEKKVLEEIAKASPQVLLCALGSPKQEFFISKLKQSVNGCVMAGVGGCFDVMAHVVDEAPIFWQKLGLEWLYRTIRQPERIKRIFPALPLFLFHSIMESIGSERKYEVGK